MRKPLINIVALLAMLMAGCGGGGDGSDAGKDDGVSPDIKEVTDLNDVTDIKIDQPIETMEEEQEADGPAEVEQELDAMDVATEEITQAEGVVGDPCTGPDECLGVPSDNRQCITDVFGFTLPGGYCTAQCSSPDECGEGANCVGFINYCLKLCSEPEDCRMSEGYQCAELPIISDGNTYCIPQMGGETADY